MNHNWLQRQIIDTDIGLLSVVTWLACLFFGCLTASIGYLIVNRPNELAWASIGLIVGLLFVYIVGRQGRNLQVKPSKAAIHIISFVIVEFIAVSMLFSFDPKIYPISLFLHVLVSPAFIVYAILYFQIVGRAPVSIWAPGIIVIVQIGYLSYQTYQVIA